MSSSGPSSNSSELPHPLLWRGTQMAPATQSCVATGHAALSAALPGGGWPLGSLVELLLAQAGIGELRLLQPALLQLAPQRRIVLLHPPHTPHATSWLAARFSTQQLLWVKPEHANDAMWAAEQILKNGSCSALLYWPAPLRSASLRRLHLAAQGSDSLFFMFRPMACAGESSPAPLRLILQAAQTQLRIDVIKRRGPRLAHPLFIPLLSRRPADINTTFTEQHHALVDQRPSDTTQPRRPQSTLVS